MGLLLEDIKLTEPTNWRAIVCTGTVVHIVAVKSGDVMVRFGISSISPGVAVAVGDTLSAGETIYVRAKRTNVNGVVPTITVVRD